MAFYTMRPGNVNRVARVGDLVVHPGVPVDLSAEDRKALEAQGFTFEKSSKSEAQELAEQPPVGGDVAGAEVNIDQAPRSVDK